MAAVAPAWPLYSGSPSSSLRPSGMSSYAASTILTEMEPVAVLSHPRLDSAPEVFDNMPTSRPGAEESIATAQARVVQAAATISKDMPRAVLDLKRRLDEQQARDRTSFDKLRGELAKLTSMATQLAVSIGKQTTSAIPGSSPLGVIGTAPVAPKVFDKRPTPSSGHGNQASTTTAPTISVGFIPSSGSTTLAASAPWLFSAVVGSSASSPSDASTAAYVAPSVIDEMPQSYGFSNLTRQSILLADGTEHSYFTLPADYHLEQAVSEPVFDVYADETEDCSNVFVDVLADSFGQSNAFVDVLPRNSVQQPYEVEQRQSHQAPKCFSNPNFSPERPIVGTDIQQPLHLSIDEELQGDEKMLGEKSVCQSAIEHSCLNFLWDPGDARLHTLFTTSARATKFPSTHAYKCAMIHIPVGQFGASRAPSFQCAIMLSAVFGLGWTALHASALFPLVAPCSTGKYRCLPSFAMSKQQWNPGIDLFSYKKLHLFSWIPPSAILILQQLHYKNISSMWDCSLEKGKQVQWDPGIAISNLWIFISQPVDLKQFWSQLLLQRHSCSWKIAQEKEKVMVGLNPKQWTFSFNAMPYCQICEKCIAMSYQLYWHEDINFNEIHLWLIHFQPP